MNVYLDFDELLYLNLKPKEQEIFENGHLSSEHARILLDIPSDEIREKVLNYIVERRLNPEQSKKAYYNFLKKSNIKGNQLPSKIYVNTIDNVVEKISQKGVAVTSLKSETPNYFECIIRIPK